MQYQSISFVKISIKLFCVLFLLSSCTSENEEKSTEQPFIVTTTNLIRDAVEHVGGDYIKVESIMGPGVDPHVYRATPRDFQIMEKADLILYNGLFLEGRLSEILDRIGNRSHVVTGSIPKEKLIPASDYGGMYDPHVWFDVNLWIYVIQDICETLSRLMPDKADTFSYRSNRYIDELKELHLYVVNRIHDIPEDQRILLTAHDAFRYFGRAYDIEVKGLQGISTSSEVGLQDISRMVSLITNREIPAIFVETGVSTRSVESVIQGVQNRGFNVNLGGHLFSDSMGARNTPQGTYTGMIRHNVETIVQALTKNPE